MFVNSYKRKHPGYSLLPVLRVHLLDEDINLYFQAGPPDMGNNAPEFNDRSGRYRLGEIYPVAADRDHFLPAETRGCDKGYFIHQVHGSASEKRVVMIGGVRKDRFENPCF